MNTNKLILLQPADFDLAAMEEFRNFTIFIPTNECLNVILGYPAVPNDERYDFDRQFKQLVKYGFNVVRFDRGSLSSENSLDTINTSGTVTFVYKNTIFCNTFQAAFFDEKFNGTYDRKKIISSRIKNIALIIPNDFGKESFGFLSNYAKGYNACIIGPGVTHGFVTDENIDLSDYNNSSKDTARIKSMLKGLGFADKNIINISEISDISTYLKPDHDLFIIDEPVGRAFYSYLENFGISKFEPNWI